MHESIKDVGNQRNCIHLDIISMIDLKGLRK
jgi:hypothetical protein